jgi:hypothetical protein
MSFVVIYRWAVADEHHDAFRARWRESTLHLRKHGSLGSCLTRDGNGEFVAIALWPSEAVRAAAFAGNSLNAPWPPVERLEETRLEVEDDLWMSSPFRS